MVSLDTKRQLTYLIVDTSHMVKISSYAMNSAAVTKTYNNLVEPPKSYSSVPIRLFDSLNVIKKKKKSVSMPKIAKAVRQTYNKLVKIKVKIRVGAIKCRPNWDQSTLWKGCSYKLLNTWGIIS